MEERKNRGNVAPDHETYVGTDPMTTTSDGTHKPHVSLDRDKVAEADRAKEEAEQHETDEERAARIKNA